MEPSEALSTAAQIAVALAGFAGVVVVFRRQSVHEWSPADKFRLRLLLMNSVLPLALCMLGLLFLTIKPPPVGIWKWCSGFAFVILVLFAITNITIFRRLQLRQAQSYGRATRFVFLSVQHSWGRGDDIASVQCRHPRRVRAILHCSCFPTYRRNVSVYAHYFDAT
jgi:hypothetical protein